ncbi:Flp pilus assembly protein CpaB, partial [Streptomyces capparidis]
AAVLAAPGPPGPGGPPGGTAAVLVAARDLPAGEKLDGDEVSVAELPADRVPAGAVRAPGGARGRVLAAPVRHGEPLTDRRLLGPALLAGYGEPGGERHVAAPVRVADAGSAALLRPGDRIDVLAGPPGGEGGAARVVAAGVRVIAVPPVRGRGAGEGALVVLAVPRSVAVELAGAAAASPLAVTLS